ncbi:MAG: hypothetical protein AB8G95_11230 [Anaerolineae bacterium]
MHHFYLKFRSTILFLFPACFLIALSLLGSFSVAEASESATYLANIEASTVAISVDQAVAATASELQLENQLSLDSIWNWIWDWFSSPSTSVPETIEPAPEPFKPVRGYSLAWSG